jgi:hypothetical protein
VNRCFLLLLELGEINESEELAVAQGILFQCFLLGEVIGLATGGVL